MKKMHLDTMTYFLQGQLYILASTQYSYYMKSGIFTQTELGLRPLLTRIGASKYEGRIINGALNSEMEELLL